MGLHEEVRGSNTSSWILQYGRHPIDVQAKHQPEHAIFRVPHEEAAYNNR